MFWEQFDGQKILDISAGIADRYRRDPTKKGYKGTYVFATVASAFARALNNHFRACHVVWTCEMRALRVWGKFFPKLNFVLNTSTVITWLGGRGRGILRRSCVTIKMVQQGMTTSLSDYDTRTRRRAACEKNWKPIISQSTAARHRACLSQVWPWTKSVAHRRSQFHDHESWSWPLPWWISISLLVSILSLPFIIVIVVVILEKSLFSVHFFIESEFEFETLFANREPRFEAKQMWKRKTNKWQGHINSWANTTSRKPQNLPKNSSTRRCYEQRFLNIVNFCTWRRFPLAMAKCTGLPATTTTIRKPM